MKVEHRLRDPEPRHPQGQMNWLRWLIATAVFLAVAYYGTVAGRGRALAVLIVLLLIVAVFGGPGRSSGH